MNREAGTTWGDDRIAGTQIVGIVGQLCPRQWCWWVFSPRVPERPKRKNSWKQGFLRLPVTGSQWPQIVCGCGQVEEGKQGRQKQRQPVPFLLAENGTRTESRQYIMSLLDHIQLAHAQSRGSKACAQRGLLRTCKNNVRTGPPCSFLDHGAKLKR